MIHAPNTNLENNWSLYWYLSFAVYCLIGNRGGDYSNSFILDDVKFVCVDVQGMTETYISGKVNYCIKAF